MATSSGRWRMMGGEVGKRVVWMDRLGVVYPPQPQRWNGRCRVGGNSAWGKLDSEVGREGEEGYVCVRIECGIVCENKHGICEA